MQTQAYGQIVMKVRDRDQLNQAMAHGESTIEIEGDLARKIIRLKATGKVAWAIAIAAIALAFTIAIAAIVSFAATGGFAAPAAPVEGVIFSAALAPAIATLGFETAYAALALAVTAGGVGILTRLRSDYKIVRRGIDYVVLEKK